MSKINLFKFAVVCFFLILICSIVNATISISGVGVLANPSGSNEGLGGICYTGGTQYYAVDDSGGMMQPATISINPSSGAITAALFSVAVHLGGTDLESIDYNAVNNSIFVSDESGATIKEYGLANTNYLSSVSVPSVFSSYRSSYSLESLTIRGDGLEMWTCNEEALYDISPVVDDGPLSTDTNGSLVRLQRFARNSVHDTWSSSGQWAYLCDPYDVDSGFTESERSGVSDLCVLPDGKLLVLERAADVDNAHARFRNRIYEVDFTGATDVSSIASLNGTNYTKVSKTLHWSDYFSDTYNFEGLCIGPRLDNNALSLLMVADGDGDQDNGLYSFKMTGLSTRQLIVNTLSYGIAEPVGGPYRYVTGSTLTNSVTSPVAGDGVYYECTGWTLIGQTPSSGSGSTMTMAITNDAELTWIWQETPNPSNTIPYVETFESYDDEFVMPGTNGWSATNFNTAVVTTNVTLINTLNAYSEACGYSVTAAHDKVLAVTGLVTNNFDINNNQVIWLDEMMQANSVPLVDMNLINNSQVAFYFNTNGHPMIYNHDLTVGTNCWAEIPEFTADEGEWVRLTLKLDYQTDDPGNTVRYFQVRINGYLLTNAMAWTANDGAGVVGGSWFAMRNKPDRLTRLIFDGKGACIDDITLATDNPLLRNVEVVSMYDTVNPPVGTNGYTYGDDIVFAVTNSSIIQGTEQYVCTGWNMTGHSPASGAGTNVTIILTNDVTLTWLWSTNYWLDTEATTNGTVSPGDGWYTNGEVVVVTPNPAEQYSFDSWTGDVPVGHENDNPLTVTMGQARQIIATFRAVTYDDWASGIVWGGTDSSSGADADEDGFSNYEEYKAGTDPMDSGSLLKVSNIGNAVFDSVVIKWASVSNITYAIESSTNLMGDNWLPSISGVQATPPMNINTILVNESSVPQFLRVIVE